MADQKKTPTFTRKHREPILAFKWDGRPFKQEPSKDDDPACLIPQWAIEQAANNNFAIESHGTQECKLCIRSSKCTAKPGDVIFKEDGDYYAMTERQFKEDFEPTATRPSTDPLFPDVSNVPRVVFQRGQHEPNAKIAHLEGPGTEQYKGQQFTFKEATDLCDKITADQKKPASEAK